jgi:uncharacterized damage-inducible protein DinB
MTDELRRDPEDWKTGDEPMTAAQASYLRTLSEETGEPFEEGLTKAQASERIDTLRTRSKRVTGTGETSTAPHPSSAEGGEGAAERPPRPSQPEGER